MSQKNAYEVRLEVLRLAERILSENSESRRHHDEQIRDHLLSDSCVGILDEDGKPEKIRFDAHTYTTEDVLREAHKLYGFVGEG